MKFLPRTMVLMMLAGWVSTTNDVVTLYLQNVSTDRDFSHIESE